MYAQFTKEEIHPTTPKRFALLLLVPLVLFGVANLAVGFFGQALLLDDTSAMICLKGELLEAMDAPVDVLIVGDSSGNQSVDPAVLSEAGYSSINLCTQGRMLLVSDLAFFRQYTAKFKTGPKVLLLVHVYDIWHRPAVLYNSPLEKDVIDRAGIEKPFAHRWNWKKRLLDHVIPLIVKGRVVGDSLRGIPPFSFENDRGYFAARNHYPESLARDLTKHLEELKTKPQGIPPIQIDTLKEILSLARKQNTQVVLAFPPVHQGLSRSGAYQGLLANYRKELLTVVGEDHFTILPLAEAVVAEDLTNTVDHIRHPAAQNFTRFLLGQLAPYLGAPSSSAER